MLLPGMMSQVRLRAQLALRRAAMNTVGGLLMLVGLAFLLLAAWLALSIVLGAIYASLIVGLIFLGLGLIFMALARRPPRALSSAAPAIPPATTGAVPPPAPMGLMAAFLFGIDAGRSIRSRRR